MLGRAVAPSWSCAGSAPWAGSRRPRRPSRSRPASDARRSTASSHLGRGLDAHDLRDPGRDRPVDGRDERDVRAPLRRGLGDRVALLARRAVGDDPHRVDRFARAARGDEDPEARPACRRRVEERLERAAAIRSGSARRPAPTSPPARRPDSGSTTCTPRRRSVARFSWTAGCSHISVCIAGHTSTGARVASSVAVSRSSEMPAAYLPSSFAVAGATTTRSALWPSRVCGIGSGPSNSEVRAGSDASAENVSAPTNRCASSVRTGATCTPASTSRRHTSTALYAAIPPLTPRTTRRLGAIAAT